MGHFPRNPYEDERDPVSRPSNRGETRTMNQILSDLHASLDKIKANPCKLDISPRCTREDGYQWHGRLCCAHCFSLAEASWEQAQDLNRAAQR